MDELITILSLGKPWDIEQLDGSHLTGCTMWYLPSGDISHPVEDAESGTLGIIPSKERMGVEFYELAKNHGLPCQAKATYGMKTKNNQTVLYIKGVDFVDKKSK